MKIVAIDPDVEKSGIAFLDTESRELKTDNLFYFKIIYYGEFQNYGGDTERREDGEGGFSGNL